MSASTVTDGDAPERWRALTVCLLAGFMTLLDVSIVNVAVPSMEEGLDASSGQVSWVVSGYALMFGLALVPAGKLGDSLGRKQMFLLGLAAFTVVSLLCGLAQSETWLVVCRLLQGMSGGILNPQVIAMIQQLFRGRERGTAFGFYSAAIGISTAIGPLVGGLLIQLAGFESGWRWVFYVNLPVGLLALFFGMRLLPHTPAASQRQRLDVVGVLLLGVGISAVMLPLIEAEEQDGTVHWYLLVIGVLLLALFVGWEQRYRHSGREPVVDLSLLRARSYAVGVTIGFTYFAGFTGIFLVLTVYFQQGLDYSALAAGAATLPFALGSAASSALGGRVVHRFGRAMIVFGLLAVALGLAATAVLIRYQSSSAVWMVILGPLLLAGIGSGVIIGPNQTLTFQQVPPAQGGSAAAVLQTSQRVGSALGIAVAASLFFGRLAGSGNFPVSASLGLFGSAGLVGCAFLAALLGHVVLGSRTVPAA